MIPAAVIRPLATAAMLFIGSYIALGRRLTPQPGWAPRDEGVAFTFTFGPGAVEEDLEDAMDVVVSMRHLLTIDPSLAHEDGGSACFSH